MTLSDDAIKIWQAGVNAVRSDELVERHVHCTRDRIEICDSSISVEDIRRIEIVGGGKAGAGMSRGLLRALAPLRGAVEISGWVNVPADCVESIECLTLFAARPAGINEPTDDGVHGTREILNRVRNLRPADLCFVLLSGGGSALLPAPVPDLSLADKLAVTRLLARSGASINELNIVRAQLSQIKGGGLLRHCRAEQMHSLIISDVIGDPLDIIASGPTTASPYSADDALKVLQRYDPDGTQVPLRIRSFLHSKQNATNDAQLCHAENHVIGSNSVAVAAAIGEARRRGYDVVNLGSENSGDAAEHGRKLFQRLQTLKSKPGRSTPVCVLAGGETTVRLVATDRPRKGGRNQEVVLAAVAAHPYVSEWRDLVLLSGGTDGEDGPTDAAGAMADEDCLQRAANLGLVADEYLAINDSWTFFDASGGLIRTGPTHTNVMDLAVGLVQ